MVHRCLNLNQNKKLLLKWQLPGTQTCLQSLKWSNLVMEILSSKSGYIHLRVGDSNTHVNISLLFLYLLKMKLKVLLWEDSLKKIILSKIFFVLVCNAIFGLYLNISFKNFIFVFKLIFYFLRQPNMFPSIKSRPKILRVWASLWWKPCCICSHTMNHKSSLR